MEKINGFQITGMTLSGFKSYAEPTDLVFGNPTVITGGNGTGKSSIADAIAFAITGLPFFGERGIDRLHSEENPEVFVSLRIADHLGNPHELTRTRQKNRMTITYDGYEIRQLDLTELFGERDVFLSIFNPLYFIEELGDEGKHLLERYLPAVSHEDVLSELSEHVRLALEPVEMLSPEGLLKCKRENIRALEESAIYLSGQRDLSSAQERDGQQAAQELEQTLSALTTELETLEALRLDGIDQKEFEERLVERSARYEEMARGNTAESTCPDLDERIGALRAKLDVRREESYVPKYTQPTAEANARLRELAGRYQRENQLKNAFAAGMTCPTCRRAVTEANLPDVLAEFDKSIADLYTQGSEQRGQLQELQALEQQGLAVFEQFRTDDVQKLEAEWNTLVEQRADADGQIEQSGTRRGAELDALQQEIRALTTALEYGNLTQEEYDQLIDCREKQQTCQAELAAMQSVVLKPAADYEAQIAQVQTGIIGEKKLISDIALYIAKRAELTFQQLRMNRVAISLYDVVKSTGEVKDVFRFTYNGRLYNRLSLSEKIRAGMEVSELMKKLAGRNYPVFADNMESVDDLANVRPTGQVIMAKCVRGAALSVVPARVPTTQSKAA